MDKYAQIFKPKTSSSQINVNNSVMNNTNLDNSISLNQTFDDNLKFQSPNMRPKSILKNLNEVSFDNLKRRQSKVSFKDIEDVTNQQENNIISYSNIRTKAARKNSLYFEENKQTTGNSPSPDAKNRPYNRNSTLKDSNSPSLRLQYSIQNKEVEDFYLDVKPNEPTVDKSKNENTAKQLFQTVPTNIRNKIDEVKKLYSEYYEQYSFNINNTRIIEIKADEYKNLVEDPNYTKLIYDKKVGVVEGFSANFFKNTQNPYNDIINVGINLKVKNCVDLDPSIKQNINFFSIFDLHGKAKLGEELRINLRNNIMSDPDFMKDTEKTILRAFDLMEKEIFKKIKENGNVYNGGSSAIAIINHNQMFYVANLGNSRGILSKDLGQSIYQISVDHTPSNEKEKDRIIKMGGSAVLSDDNPQRPGVYITKPGKLEVSRSFGYANLKEGNPGLVLSIPDIISFELKEDFDFIILGSDGLFDKMTNKEITIKVFETMISCILSNYTYSQMLIKVTNRIVVEAIERNSNDCISCIFICFNKLFNAFNNKEISQLDCSIKNLKSVNDDYTGLYSDLKLRKLFTLSDEEKILKDTADPNLKSNNITMNANVDSKKSKSVSCSCQIV